MGFGDKLRGFFKKTSGFIKNATRDFRNFAIGAEKKVEMAVSTIHQDARDLVNGVGNFASKTIKGGQEMVKYTIDKTKGVINDTGKNLALPLEVGAGVIGLGIVGIGAYFVFGRTRG